MQTACELTLKDEEGKELKVRVGYDENSIYLMPEGYGDPTSAPGHGKPVYLDWYAGKLQLCVYPDINGSDSPQVIELGNAMEAR